MPQGPRRSGNQRSKPRNIPAKQARMCHKSQSTGQKACVDNITLGQYLSQAAEQILRNEKLAEGDHGQSPQLRSVAVPRSSKGPG